jgi:hypothetical protein
MVDDGRLYPFAIYQQVEMQKLAAEQPLPGQVVRSVKAGGTDRPSQYKSRLPNKKNMDVPLYISFLGALEYLSFINIKS